MMMMTMMMMMNASLYYKTADNKLTTTGYHNQYTDDISYILIILPVFVEVFKAENVKDTDTGAILSSTADWSIYCHVDSVDNANKHAAVDSFHKRISDVS